jgi:tripartite-type tricarboxylate transporter receptor subunit TctC
LPDVPTMAEAGMPDFDTSIWFGVMAPAGTPRPVIDMVARTINQALAADEILAGLKTQGFDALGGSPEDFARTIADDAARWRAVATAAGLKK